MEPIGFALGIITLVKPVCEFIHETWTAHTGFGADSERLRLRFSIQTSRLTSFESLLFTPSKFTPPLPPQARVIDHVPPHLIRDIAALFAELYGFLQDYAALSEKYSMRSGDEARSDLAEALGKMQVGKNDGKGRGKRDLEMLMELGGKAGGERHGKVEWLKKTTWALRDKKKTEEMVKEFEEYTERMKCLIEVAWWPMPFFQSLSGMAQVEKDADAKDAGICDGINIRKILVEPDVAQPGKATRNLELARVNFKEKDKFGPFDIGTLDGHYGLYMVEYRQLTTAKRRDQERIVQLVALLNEAAEIRKDFKILPCAGYFHDSALSRMGIVSHLPGSSPKLTSLSERLSSTARLRPDLKARMTLASALVDSMLSLHSFGWVHKSIRSENILFVDEGAGEWKLEDPRLSGFEYSRLEGYFSSGREQNDQLENLYRHPLRWGEPQVTFQKAHDIYAVGVVLLEIGLWQRVDELDRGRYMSREFQTDPELIRHKFLLTAKKGLKYYAGERYASFVALCLSDAGDGEDDKRKREEALESGAKSLKSLASEL